MSIELGAGMTLNHVQHSYRDTGPVLDDVNLQIAAGEFVVFLGPSGCGKSTLLRLIAGLEMPTSGSIDLPAVRGSSRGFVFQEAHLLPWLTVLDNAALPLELQKIMKRPLSLTRAETVLRQVGLGDSLHKYPNQLSGGMKMRVSIARALVSEPGLLLLDEPFAALDEATRFQLQEDLRELWLRQKMTVIFVTHSISEAVFLADRALVFSVRPARLVLDHRIALGEKRSDATRLQSATLREIEILTQAFRSGDGRTAR